MGPNPFLHLVAQRTKPSVPLHLKLPNQGLFPCARVALFLSPCSPPEDLCVDDQSKVVCVYCGVFSVDSCIRRCRPDYIVFSL
jgi:hypothetical protein